MAVRTKSQDLPLGRAEELGVEGRVKGILTGVRLVLRQRLQAEENVVRGLLGAHGTHHRE